MERTAVKFLYIFCESHCESNIVDKVYLIWWVLGVTDHFSSHSEPVPWSEKYDGMNQLYHLSLRKVYGNPKFN